MGKQVLREKSLGYEEFVLASAKVAEQGHTACLNTATGLVQPAESGITTLLPIGTFALINDAAGITGDGTKKVTVKFPAEVHAVWRNNDSAPNNVEAGDIGNTVYLKDGTTVSTDATNRSSAGRALAIDSFKGVLVQFGIANTGPTGASGTSLQGSGVADRAALSAIPAASRYEGKIVLVQSDYSLWVFDADGTATEDENQQLIVEPDAGDGQWVRLDKDFTMKLAIAAATVDAAALCTVPAGMVLRLTGHPFWEVTTSFTGGSSSTIGASTDVTGYDTKGDLLGGAAGDAAAGLTAGVRAGTIGGELGDNQGFHDLALVAGDVIRFDRITDAFTAGAGFVCVPVSVMRTA